MSNPTGPSIPSLDKSLAAEQHADQEQREGARKRLARKIKFQGDLIAYEVINAFLIVIWAVSDRGYFWPGWVLGGWGVLLLLDAWKLYARRPITEADIDRELQRGR